MAAFRIQVDLAAQILGRLEGAGSDLFQFSSSAKNMQSFSPPQAEQL
jgi:hypothetical protein